MSDRALDKDGERKVRNEFRSACKWCVVDGYYPDEVTEYIKLHLTDIMEEAVEEFHDFLEWE